MLCFSQDILKGVHGRGSISSAPSVHNAARVTKLTAMVNRVPKAISVKKLLSTTMERAIHV